MYPHERSLVKRMQGQPFVLLGVNSDNQPNTARVVAENEGLSLRAWSDGGLVRGGRIASEWNIQALPTTYILDAHGVIRHKIGPRADGHDFTTYILDDQGHPRDKWELRAEEISTVVDHLIAEMRQPKDSVQTPPSGIE